MTIFGGSKEILVPQLQPDCCSLWPNSLLLQERCKDELHVKSLLFVKHNSHKIKRVSAPAAVQSLPGCASLDPGLLQERSPATQEGGHLQGGQSRKTFSKHQSEGCGLLRTTE